MMNGNWYLDGAYLGPYKSLEQKTLRQLKFIGNINGVSIYEDPTIAGTLELRHGDITMCIIRGTGLEN